MCDFHACDKPECPYNRHLEPRKDPRCLCDAVLLIALKPGQHIHPCPVHPAFTVHGPPDMTLLDTTPR